MAAPTDPMVTNRRDLVLALLALPLSQEEIGRVIGVAGHQIDNDCAFFRRTSVDTNRPDMIFGNRLNCYMLALTGNIEGFTSEIQTAIARELEAPLRLKEVEKLVRAVMHGIHTERMPRIPASMFWTQYMMEAIYGIGVRDSGLDFQEALKYWWQRNQEAGLPPENQQELAHLVATAYYYGNGIVMREGAVYVFTHDDFSPPTAPVFVTPATTEAIEAAILMRTDRQKFVINEHIPKNGLTGLAFGVIGKKMGLTQTRVCQIWAETMTSLRKYLDEHHDVSPIPLLDTEVVTTRGEIQRLKAELALARYEIERLKIRTQETEEGTAGLDGPSSVHLRKRVDELDLSVRSANCLQWAGIEFIWQLCEKTEGEMLKTKNFGRKSLNEIKDILAEIGLSLGMKNIPDWIKAASRLPTPAKIADTVPDVPAEEPEE